MKLSVFFFSVLVSLSSYLFAEASGLPTTNIFYFDNFAFTKEGHCDFKGICLETNDDDDVGDPFDAGVAGNNQDEQKIAIARKVNETYLKSHKEFNRLIRTAAALEKHHTGEMDEIRQLKQEATDKILEAYRKVESIEKCALDLEAARHELQLAEESYTRALQSKDRLAADLQFAEAEKRAANALSTCEYYDDKIQAPTKNHHTTCTICNVTCHEACSIGFKTGSAHLTECTCITDGECRICPGRCSFTQHAHQRYVWKTEQKRRDLTANQSRQSSANATYNSLSNQLNAKVNDVINKDQTKNRKAELFAEFNRRLEILKQEKDCLQKSIVKLYVQLSHVSISPVNYHIGEYYHNKLRNEQDAVKRAKLNRDRQFYEEQVALYREQQQNNI